MPFLAGFHGKSGELTSPFVELSGRKKRLQILFVHHDMEAVDRCSHELNKLRFTVNWTVVNSAELLRNRLQAKNYDVVISEHPPVMWKGPSVPTILRDLKKGMPLIFTMVDGNSELQAELIMKGAWDCVEMANIGHLPVTVLRALGEKALRDERDRAQKELRRAEARYRALAGNLNYGILHCNLDGAFTDANQTFLKILGIDNEESLKNCKLMREIVVHAGKRAQLLGQTDELDPLEVEWKPQDGRIVKMRLSGRRLDSEEPDAYEVIVEDITKQRALEDHLRRLAASDPLTGLGNYRHLIELLDMEIRRSKRTEHEFSLLILDVDGLKRINDQYGHVMGNQALCRVADILTMCCRDIDSAIRFGGDEFAVVLPEAGKEAANSAALRICANVQNDGKHPNISVSAGVATFPVDGDKVESLIKVADAAMFAIKRKKLVR